MQQSKQNLIGLFVRRKEDENLQQTGSSDAHGESCHLLLLFYFGRSKLDVLVEDA